MTAKFAIILAAGQGTRMKSKLYKVLHPVCGKPMVEHMLSQVEKDNVDEIVTIIGCGAAQIKKTLGERTEYALQTQQLGTGHAVMQAEKILGNKDGMTLVVCGDTPLFTAETFAKLFKYHEDNHDVATVLTAEADDPFSYGRVVRNNKGEVEKIVEQKDTTPSESKITEINTGVYVFDNRELFKALHQVNNNNAQGEYYLPDVIGIFQQEGKKVGAYKMKDFNESMGVNDRIALAKATKIMQAKINRRHMENGVTIIDPDSTYIDADVKIGEDTTIEPGVQLKGNTVIGKNCFIGAHSEIKNCTLEDGVHVIASYLEDSTMHKNSNIGPYSHLRPLADIDENVHIGNFVEVKKAQIGKNTKVGHLTYVGDATLGKDINVGCGTIFINYDGMNKHHTNVGDYSFIGSGANLIAPLEIGDHAYVAAGSTITNDVPPHAMGIGRGRQVNKAGYYDRYPVAETARKEAAAEKVAQENKDDSKK